MSDDRFLTLPDGRELCWRETGEGAPLLLIIGLGLQMIAWPPELIDGLVARGFRVITFDNRDVGRSSRLSAPPPSTWRLMTRRARSADYDLGDMAGDAVALLDHLGIDRAHVAGMSMGGMIGQVLAARHPDRVASLTSIFSTTGAAKAGQPSLAVKLHMMRPPARTRDRAAAETLRIMRIIGGRGPHAIDEARIRAASGAAWDRALPRPQEGMARQLMAIFKSGDRTADVARIAAPTTVIHGDRDTIVHPSGGAATAAAIPHARHVVVPDMGHDLPVSVIPQVCDLIAETAERDRVE